MDARSNPLPISIPGYLIPAATRYFWKHVRRDGECLLWTGQVEKHGYGRLHWPLIDQNRKVLAHRWAYTLFVGPIPSGFEPDHLCRIPRCVNWKHIELVPPRTNILRGTGPTAINARKTHCPNGHPLTEDNQIPWERRCRSCFICHREFQKKYQHDYYLKRKALAHG